MELHTLVDFLMYSKGSGYLIGAAVLLCFIPFWLFLTERERD